MPTDDFGKQYGQMMRKFGNWKKAGPPRPRTKYFFTNLDTNSVLTFRNEVVVIPAFSAKQAIRFLKRDKNWNSRIPRLRYMPLTASLKKSDQPIDKPPEKPKEDPQGSLGL